MLARLDALERETPPAPWGRHDTGTGKAENAFAQKIGAFPD